MTETLSDAAPAEETKALAASGAMAFSLGDPEPVLNRRELLDSLDCWAVTGVNGRRYYQPPLPMTCCRRRATSPRTTRRRSG